jgi:two-component system cell cycle sensor histidine kinase/response regulator CckA
MSPTRQREQLLQTRLDEAEATIRALLSGEVDAVFDAKTSTPVMLAKAQHALRESEERMRFALTATNIGLWDQDCVTGRVQWSDVLERMYGVAPGEFDGTFEAFAEAIHPDDRAATLLSIGQAIEQGTDFDVRHRIVWRDGSVHWLHCIGRAVLGPDGHPLRAVGICQDVTEHHVLERQYLQSQRLEAVGRLAGGIAHDFNNILSVILSCGDFMLEDLPPHEPARRDAEEICKAGRRAADLTKQLLMFSRQQVLAPKVLDLTAVASNMEGMLRRLVGEDVDLRFQSRGAISQVRADPGTVEQVILNLVVNARDAMPTGGTLTIETHEAMVDAPFARAHLQGTAPGRYMVLAVRDTGAGMDAATQARIFEPFYTTKPVGTGTGLGLATVFGIVAQSRGAIHVDSTVGAGSVFSVYLPAIVAEVDDGPAEASAPVPRGDETILLVEDEEQVRTVARIILLRQGYRVIEKRTPADAFLHCRHNPERIDLLLTDVVMPLMSGPELARRLQQMRPELKVLYMSGYTDDNVVRHGVQLGETAFLQKPFTSASLARKVRDALA